MHVIRTLDFDEAYAEAPIPVQRSADRRLEYLSRDFRHPSLRAKPWPEDGPNCYQANLADGWRFYYMRQGDDAVAYWMQKHPKKGG